MVNYPITNDMSEITITLPAALLTTLNEYVPTPQRSQFVQRAIEELLAIEAQTQALAETAGTWSGEAYTDLDNPEAVELWLQTFRGSWSAKDVVNEPVVA